MHPTSGDAVTWRRKRLDKEGYYARQWWDGPRPDRKLCEQKEHRWVIEGVLGRKLQPWEIVHHRDHDKLNNDPTNLEVQEKAHHDQHHVDTRTQPWPERHPRCGQLRSEAGLVTKCKACANEYARANYRERHGGVVRVYRPRRP